MARRAAGRRRRRDRDRDRERRGGFRLRALLPMARRPPAGASRGASPRQWTRNRLLSRSRGWRGPRRGGSLGPRARACAGRYDRRAARSVLDPGPELEPAGAQSARRRAPGLGAVHRGRRRQHAPRRHVAHRPCDGLSAALSHSRRSEAGGRRLSRLPARRYHRPLRAREPARQMHGRRRGPRHSARKASATG